MASLSRQTASRIDPLALGMVPRKDAADGAHLALHYVSQYRPETQAMALAVAFAALCQRCDLDPQEMYGRGSTLLHTRQGNHRQENDSLQSLQDYVGIHLAGREGVGVS